MKQLFLAVVLMFVFIGSASAYQHAMVGSVHWTNPEPSGSPATTEFNTQFTVDYNIVFSSEAACKAAKAKLNLATPLIFPTGTDLYFGNWKKIILVDCFSLD